MLGTLAFRILIYLGMAATAVGIGFRMGYVVERNVLDAYSAKVTAAAAKADRDNRAIQAKNEIQQQRVNDEAQSQIGDMSRELTDLSMRLNAAPGGVRPVPAAPGAAGPHGQPVGPGAGPGDQCTANQEEDDALLDALSSIKLWREYARSTGQAK